MTLRFGWREELLPPEIDRLSDRLRLARRASPSAVSLVVDVDLDVLDQGGTSSCVAQATAQAIRLRTAIAQGKRDLASVPTPSRRWIYRLARETHHEGDVDDGTFISAALFVTRDQGWPTEEHVPWDEARVNEPMGDTARLHAYDQRDAVSEYAIIDRGTALEGELRAALAAGYPVVFGATVPQSWCNLGYDWTPQHWGFDDAGGHAMIAVGYDAEGVHVLNSWGAAWGLGGLGRVAWDTARTRLRDLRVITVAERATS